MPRYLCGMVLFFAGLFGAGCATIAHGTRQTVTVISDPPGAQVTVLSGKPGEQLILRSKPGLTPLQLDLTRRDANIVIRLDKEGCSPVEIPVKRAVSGWTAGNLVFANPLSMQGMTHPETQYPQQVLIGVPILFGIDVASGAAFKLPKTIRATICPP